MATKVKDLEAILQQKYHFERDKNRANDHRWYVLKVPGMPPIRTMVSHGHSEVSSDLEAKIAQQLHVRKPFFASMIGCTKSNEDYLSQIKAEPYPPFPNFGKK